MEVIYGGLRQTPAMIVSTALAEDVQVIGLSILSGGHMGLVEKVMAELSQAGMSDVAVVVGGVIPDEDVPALRAMGVAEVFPSSTALAGIPERVRALAEKQQSLRSDGSVRRSV